MAELLLPGTPDFKLATWIEYSGAGWNHGGCMKALRTIESLWRALHILYATNAEGHLKCVKAWATCPTCPTAQAWKSDALAEIRRAIEKEAT